MNIIIDMNLSLSWCDLSVKRIFEAVHSAVVGNPDGPHHELCRAAHDNSYRSQTLNRQITDEYFVRAVDAPYRREIQSDGRIKLWGYVPEQDRYLRVILLPDGQTVHNAFFDRSFKEDQR